MTQIKAILLDLGKVLVDFRERREVVRSIIESFHGYADGADSVFDIGDGEAPYKQLDLGQVTHEELWRSVCRAGHLHPVNLTFEMFTALYVDHLKPFDEVVAIVRKLQNKYKLVVVSNGDFGSRYTFCMLETFHRLHFFHAFISSQEGVAKPVLIERAASILERSHTFRPEECLYVDDLAKHVDAARKLDVRAFQHDSSVEPAAHFVMKLKDFDIVV